MTELKLTIPLVPIGVNVYVRHTRQGRHYVTREALRFKEAVAILAQGRIVTGANFEVEAVIYQGPKQHVDVDGFSKLILDGLEDSGVFHNGKKSVSDYYVTDLILRRRRDLNNPRTEITVRGIA